MDRARSSPWCHAGRRWPTAGSNSGDLDPDRIGVAVGSAVGATMGLDRGVPRRQRRRPAGSGRPQVRGAAPVRLLRAELVRRGGGLAGRRRGTGHRDLHRLHLRPGLGGHAADLIREGSADVMIAGAADAPISPITVACFDAIKATTPRNDDPEHASRPFDLPQRLRARRGRGGVRPGGTTSRPGGAARASTPRSRASPPAATPIHMTGLRPDGREMAEAISDRLAEARVDAVRDRLRQRSRLGHPAE